MLLPFGQLIECRRCHGHKINTILQARPQLHAVRSDQFSIVDGAGRSSACRESDDGFVQAVDQARRSRVRTPHPPPTDGHDLEL